MRPLLEVRGLTHRFGGLIALKDVDLHVDVREILGVIGSNGAGKTTLVNLVTGHLRPMSGTIRIDGADVTGARPWRIAALGAARTFQIAKPFHGLTVRENVALGAMFTGGERSVRLAHRRADQVLGRVGLADHAKAHPAELTIAAAKRLELAKALAMRPRLLLLDEVMAGLRPPEILQAVALIRSLRNQDGITIIVIEHVMRPLMALSDEVIVLHEGRVLKRGTPHAVANDERVIAAYLGERYVRRQRERIQRA